MKIDLRKNKSKIFWVDKETLEILDGEAHYNIVRIHTAIIWYECAGYEGCKREYKIYKKRLNRYVKISREDCKIFRNMDDESKRLFIELKED